MGLSLLAVVVLLGALSLRQIWAADYWWQWKTGQYVAEHGVPRTDPFSFTNPDHERIEVRWGYCLALYGLTSAFGHESAVVLKTIAILVAFVLVGRIALRRAPAVVTAAVLAIAAMASSQRFFVRPEAGSYVLFAFMLFVITRARERRTRAIYLLPVLQILWVNFHSLFVMGPVLVAIWLAAELLERTWPWSRNGPAGELQSWRLQAAAILLPAMLVACLVNPYFHRAATLPIVQFAALSGTAMEALYVELKSPFTFGESAIGLSFYKLLIGCAVASALANLRRLDPFWLLVVAANTVLSAMAIRNLALFGLAAVPFVVQNVGASGLLSRLSTWRAYRAMQAALALGLILFCGQVVWSLTTNRFYVERGDTNAFGVGMGSHTYPIEAARFLRTTGVEGPIFNTSLAGSVLLAHDFKVFVDPRGEVYVDRVIDEYREIVSRPERFPRFAERYGLRVFFVEIAETGLILELWKHSAWRLVRLDPAAAIFFRSDTAPEVPAVDPVNDESWLRSLYAGLEPRPPDSPPGPLDVLSSPVPLRDLGRLCFALGGYEASRRLLSDARAIYPPGFTSFELLAYASMATGHDREAAEHYRSALESDPNNALLHKEAAQVNLRLGRLEQARREIELALGLKPDNASAQATLGTLEAREGRFDLAAQAFRRAIELDPDVAEYRAMAGWALVHAGRPAEGVPHLEAALGLEPEDPQSLIAMVQAQVALGDKGQAERWLERARAVSPDHPALERLRRILGQP